MKTGEAQQRTGPHGARLVVLLDGKPVQDRRTSASRFKNVPLNLLPNQVKTALMELEAGKLSPIGEETFYSLVRTYLERVDQLELAEREIERLTEITMGQSLRIEDLDSNRSDLFDKNQSYQLALINIASRGWWLPRFNLRKIARKALECPPKS